MKKTLLITAILILASCSHYDQKIRLQLNVESEKSKISKGVGIKLEVVDEREEIDLLGEKEFCDDTKIAITSQQNLANLVQRKIESALADRGFSKGNDRVVKIAIQKLNYEAECEFLVGESKANLLIVVSTANSKEKLTKNFELSQKNKHFLLPLAQTDKKIINDLLSRVIEEILKDDILLK
jgi:uncharacterized lipoprotein YajG